MKKILLLFGMFLLFSCSNENDKNNVGNVETANVLNNQEKFKGAKENFLVEETQGIPFMTNEGIVYVFNNKKEDIYNNAFTFLSENLNELDVLKDILFGNIRYEYHLHYVSIFNIENHKKILLVVSNEEGHEYVHSLSSIDKEQYESIIFVYEIAKLNNKDFNLNLVDNTESYTSNSYNNWNFIDIPSHDFIGIIVDVDFSGGKKCSSGGEGATSCQIEDVFSGCSVSCGSGYYACCNSGSNNCKCVSITPKK